MYSKKRVLCFLVSDDSSSNGENGSLIYALKFSLERVMQKICKTIKKENAIKMRSLFHYLKLSLSLFAHQ
jgi:hypothetical protein